MTTTKTNTIKLTPEEYAACEAKFSKVSTIYEKQLKNEVSISALAFTERENALVGPVMAEEHNRLNINLDYAYLNTIENRDVEIHNREEGKDIVEQEISHTENAFSTIDGHFLKYDYTYIKAKNGLKSTYQQKTNTFLKKLSDVTKKYHPRIDLKAGNGAYGIFGDFDNLQDALSLIPENMPHSNWSDFRSYIKSLFWNACLITSASGKAKLFFPLSYPFHTSTKKTEKILELLLGNRIMYAINRDDINGRRYSFVDNVSYPVLATYLKSESYLTDRDYNDMVVNELFKSSSKNTKNKEKEKEIEKEIESKDIVELKLNPTDKALDDIYDWNCSDIQPPENMLNILETKIPMKHIIKTIQYALGGKSSIETSGVDIPQTLLAKCLGTSQRYAGTVLKECLTLGIIIKTNNYISRVKAFSYRFNGFWLVWAKQQRRTAPEAFQSGLKAILGTITTGNWNMPLFKLTNYFGNETEYLSFVRALPDFNGKPERERQAINAWKCHSKIDSAKIEREQRLTA